VIQKLIESINTHVGETDSRDIRWAVRAPLAIAEHELGTGVVHNKIDHLRREAIIHRNRNQACTHNGEVRSEVPRTVRGKDGNAIATFKSALCNRTCSAICHCV
jgi:hypothetical protein